MVARVTSAVRAFWQPRFCHPPAGGRGRFRQATTQQPASGGLRPVRTGQSLAKADRWRTGVRAEASTRVEARESAGDTFDMLSVGEPKPSGADI